MVPQFKERNNSWRLQDNRSALHQPIQKVLHRIHVHGSRRARAEDAREQTLTLLRWWGGEQRAGVLAAQFSTTRAHRQCAKQQSKGEGWGG